MAAVDRWSAMMAVDVSPNGDWSEVRVWFDPVQGLGNTHWPVAGFIYGQGQSAPRGGPAHGLATTCWTADPIGAIIAAFSGKR
jgi:hypothetical protein